MVTIDRKVKHPTAIELADYLEGRLAGSRRTEIETHLASCGECLAAAVAAHEAVNECGKTKRKKKWGFGSMKKLNIYLIIAIIAFALSFMVPRYFVQLLVATLLCGMKWIVDSKSTRMLVMIHEAWKRGGECEASRVIEKLDNKRW